MQRYLLQLSYKGTRYHGWQVQPNGNSVQEVLEKSLNTILRESIKLTGAGRTDAGVHALFFIAHFDSDNNSLDQPDFIFRLNRFLPEDIAVNQIRKVASEFHARFSAVSRTYIYIISRVKNPFIHDASYYYSGNLDIEKMNQAAELIIGRNDFTSFCRLHTDVKTNICNVTCAKWEENDARLIFTIKADRFLRNMVRAIVGTLIDIGRGKLTVDEFRLIIERRDRQAAGASAPAKGLFLKSIDYEENIKKGKDELPTHPFQPN